MAAVAACHPGQLKHDHAGIVHDQLNIFLSEERASVRV